MRCPKCSFQDDKVIDSRASKEGSVIRRRRECLKCSYRFTTYEEVEKESLYIIKKDGSRQEFDKKKIIKSMVIACQKRPVSHEKIEQLTTEIVDELSEEFDREVPAESVGEKVMTKLRAIDEVAYVRFASVYRSFRDINDFVSEVKSLSIQ
ncbi:MAG: transcriptional regulator NrdR [Verrucomicrobiae bacterium]|nr:transcriptional regulator NrdR [Verrucomicrobiae bacterium]